jgi:hypothetical protein
MVELGWMQPAEDGQRFLLGAPSVEVDEQRELLELIQESDPETHAHFRRRRQA